MRVVHAYDFEFEQCSLRRRGTDHLVSRRANGLVDLLSRNASWIITHLRTFCGEVDRHLGDTRNLAHSLLDTDSTTRAMHSRYVDRVRLRRIGRRYDLMGLVIHRFMIGPENKRFLTFGATEIPCFFPIDERELCLSGVYRHATRRVLDFHGLGYEITIFKSIEDL